MTEKKKNGSGGKTRREFLKDAGLLVGGTAIGSTVLLAACGGGETTVTDTKTVTAGGSTVTDTTTVTAGVATVTDTTTVTAGGATATVTETQTTSRFICPVDGIEFDTLAELQTHFEAEHPEGVPGLITLTVNGNNHVVQVKPNWTLAFVLREKLGLTGVKVSCDRATCGHCTVIVDGKAVYSCALLAIEADGKVIETVEGLSDGVTLSPLQQSFVDHQAFQCGYCTPGFLMVAKALLDEKPNPTIDEAREALSGHLCVCGNYKRVVEAILG